jgi:hypothetical protein
MKVVRDTSGSWDVRALDSAECFGTAGTQHGAIEVAINELRATGGGRLAIESTGGRVELRTVTPGGVLVPG